ncbi:MAG: hypothetical protein F6K47_28160 [Symploca sp. SIO2E6]|nr:hypothetical protein [Symploca sp. SIO2E6]
MTSVTESNSNPQKYHSLLESTVAERYRSIGFNVLVEPSASQIPFDLGGYRPDILATKEPDQNLIIEVKNTAERLSVDRFKSIAAIVNEQPGWKFLLVTGDDSVPIGTDNGILTLEEIKAKLSQATDLIATGASEPAFLYLWSLLEGLLRHHSIEADIPLSRLNQVSLVNHLYSQGELSREQFHIAKNLFPIRNKAVHGYRVSHLEDSTQRLLELLKQLMGEWS